MKPAINDHNLLVHCPILYSAILFTLFYQALFCQMQFCHMLFCQTPFCQTLFCNAPKFFAPFSRRLFVGAVLVGAVHNGTDAGMKRVGGEYRDCLDTFLTHVRDHILLKSYQNYSFLSYLEVFPLNLELMTLPGGT